MDDRSSGEQAWQAHQDTGNDPLPSTLPAAAMIPGDETAGRELACPRSRKRRRRESHLGTLCWQEPGSQTPWALLLVFILQGWGSLVERLNLDSQPSFPTYKIKII